MKILGPSGELLEVKTAPAGSVGVPNFPASSVMSGFMSIIREPFSGAWQKNIVAESIDNILRFSAVYACIQLRADDISKLRPRIMNESENGGVTVEIATNNNPLGKVLDKPNKYQTRIQFFAMWIVQKLLFGNVYVFKERDARGVVIALHLLDPRTVKPLIAPDGSVWYALRTDYLAGVIRDDLEGVSASEIIHDRCNCFFHPLVGLSPIFACGISATHGIRIQHNGAKFFENMSAPSGVLTGPGFINNETAERLKKQTEAVASGQNIGRILIAGDGLKYEAMTIPASDAQLIEQLKWTVEDIARAFKVPTYKLGGQMPTFNNAGVMNTDYYTQTLQADIEAIELLLEEGLALPVGKCVEFDLDDLMRLDPFGRAETDAKEVLGGIQAPNEARAKRNLLPVIGGETPFMQQQMYPLSLLAKRDPPSSAASGGSTDSGATTTTPSTTQLALPAPVAKTTTSIEQQILASLTSKVKAFRKGLELADAA